ncbi:Structural maintenance of chromosomes protein 6 [Blyttiomyces sp. JEL0837]|nr:Structural maintenance of chromosomes protein 6 [Blyttiomyces sp. JEL0837]
MPPSKRLRRDESESRNGEGDGDDDDDAFEEPVVMKAGDPKGKGKARATGSSSSNDSATGDAPKPKKKKSEPLLSADMKKLADSVRAMPPNTGTIEHIELVNFMCHKYLEVSLLPNINFVIGHNGSGKSAILTALTICLGGKASFTNRASSIKSLLKEGTTVGAVTVRIRNQGPDAFRPEVYGSRISIERRIVKEGTGSYKIKSAKGEVISTKKEELLAMCDHMSICIDNPMAILTQDTSRMFLANSTPKDKYSFFMRGTYLAQLSQDHDLINDALTRCTNTLTSKQAILPEMQVELKKWKAKWKEIEKSEGLEREIANFENMLAWAGVVGLEKELSEAQEAHDTFTGKVEQAEGKIAEAKERINQIEQRQLAINGENVELVRAGEPLGERQREAHNEKKAAVEELRKIRHELDSMTMRKENFEKTRRQFQDKIDEEARKLDGNTRQVREEKIARIDELKNAKVAAEERLGTLTHEREGIESELVRANEEYDQLRREAEGFSSAVMNAENSLNQMKGTRTNRLGLYGPGLASLLKDIEVHFRNRQFKGHVPIGPIGLHVKLKKAEYGKVIELTLGNNLSAFIVDCHDDEKILRSLFQRHKYWGPILIQDGKTFEYQSSEPRRELLTILRCLEITDPVVLRQLIIQNQIHRAVLVESRREGDHLSENRSKDDNIAFIVTKDNIRMGGKDGGLMTIAGRAELRGAPKLFVDIEEAIQEQQRKVDASTQRLHEVENAWRAAGAKVEEVKRALEKNRMERRRVDGRVQTLIPEITRLEGELQDNEPSNIASYERFKQEAEDEIEGLVRQYRATQEKKAEFEEKVRSTTQEVESLSRELDVLLAKQAKNHDTLKKLSSNIVTITGEIKYFEDKKRENEEQVRQCERELVSVGESLKEQTAAALQVTNGVRIPCTQTSESLERKIRDLRTRLKENYKQTGSKEEVSAELIRRKKEYDDARDEVNAMWESIKAVKEALKERIQAWHLLRQYISIRAKDNFTLLMMKRGFNAKLILDHTNRTLDIRVDVHNLGEVDAPGVDSAQHEKDPKTLSGGEKSFSTVCLLVSLWEAMGNPFRALDEFDVFMDAVNRKISMELMIDNARKETSQCQYIFITPQDMSHVPGLGGSDVRVVRLRDPERNQSTLNFGGTGASRSSSSG